MSGDELQRLLGDLSTNPHKVVELTHDPDTLLASYDLEPEDRAALTSGDPERIHALVRKAVPQAALVVVIVVFRV